MAQEVFSRYVVKARLRALGPHVTSFRASQQGLDRDVELRVLPLGQVIGTPEPERFARELRTLATFDHPNLIQVLDVGKAPDALFYATYYRESQTVEEMLQAGKFPELLVAQAAIAIGSGLGYLHGREQLHRSVAPGAIFFETALKRFYIGDYTTMSPAAEAGAGAELPGLRLGMTPEVRHSLSIDARTDLFLLAASLYRMLTGVDPLPRSLPYAPPSQYVGGLSKEMDGFLVKALEADPAARFQTSAEFVAAAEHIVKKLELKALVDRGVETEPAEPPAMLSRVRIRSAAPRPQAPEEREEPAPVALSRAQIRAASPRASQQRIRAAEPPPEPERPPAGVAKKLTVLKDQMAEALAKLPQAYRVPIAAGASVLALVLLTVLSFSSSESPDERALVETAGPPPPPPPVAAGEDGPDKAPARPPITAAQVRAAPTDLTNFRDRWQSLRRWYAALPQSKQNELFPYEQLLRAKLDFAVDPRKACRQLDGLYEKAAGELK